MWRGFIERTKAPPIRALGLGILAGSLVLVVPAAWAQTDQGAITGVFQDGQDVVMQGAKVTLTATDACLSHNFCPSTGKHLTRLNTTHVLRHGAVLQGASVSEEQWLPN